jgi:hypothetical protein
MKGNLIRTISLVFCLTFSLPLFSQTSTLTVQIGMGAWAAVRPSLGWYYTTSSDWGTGTRSVGAVMDVAPEQRIAFAPAISMEYYRQRYSIRSSRGWTQYSDLRSFYARASPGLRLRISDHLFLRAGMTFQMLTAVAGRFEFIHHWAPGMTYIDDYSDHPRQVLRLLNWGPDLQFVVRIPVGSSGALDLGLTTLYSLSRIYRGFSVFPFNPKMSQIGLQLGYMLPINSRVEHGFDGNDD